VGGVTDGAVGKDGEGVLEGWDGEVVEGGHQRLDFRGNAADDYGDFAVLQPRRL
jgi:hypothetical protein